MRVRGVCVCVCVFVCVAAWRLDACAWCVCVCVRVRGGLEVGRVEAGGLVHVLQQAAGRAHQDGHAADALLLPALAS